MVGYPKFTSADVSNGQIDRKPGCHAAKMCWFTLELEI
jgi:hypothetical protein